VPLNLNLVKVLCTDRRPRQDPADQAFLTIITNMADKPTRQPAICWTMRELVRYQVPLPAWVAPKRRGRPPKPAQAPPLPAKAA
jgi:hypothetical protein